MPQEYLVTCFIDGEFCRFLMTMQKIAHMVGFRDCDEYEHLRIYCATPAGVQELEYADYHRELKVSLYDSADNEIDCGYYEDH